MKQKVPMICNIVSLILLIVFVIKSIVDYTQYSTSLNSAPFYLWVLVNALFFGNSCNYFVRYWFRCKKRNSKQFKFCQLQVTLKEYHYT